MSVAQPSTDCNREAAMRVEYMDEPCECGHCPRYVLIKDGEDGNDDFGPEVTIYDADGSIEVNAWLPPDWAVVMLAEDEQAPDAEVTGTNGATIRLEGGELSVTEPMVWGNMLTALVPDNLALVQVLKGTANVC